MAVCVVVGVSGVPGGRLRGMDGVVGVGDVGICGCAPLRPGHPPLVSLRCTRAPLRWSEGGLLVVGVCVGVGVCAPAWGSLNRGLRGFRDGEDYGGGWGCRMRGGDLRGMPLSAPGIPRSFRCAALAPPYAGAKGACWWLSAWGWG